MKKPEEYRNEFTQSANRLGADMNVSLRSRCAALEAVREAAEPIATFTNDRGPFGSDVEFIHKQRPLIDALRSALDAARGPA